MSTRILGTRINGAPIQGIDQHTWARFSDYGKHDPTRSLEVFRVTWERLVHLLKILPRESWDSCGVHSERGTETATRVVEMLAEHDVNHMTQIREILSKKAGSSRKPLGITWKKCDVTCFANFPLRPCERYLCQRGGGNV